MTSVQRFRFALCVVVTPTVASVTVCARLEHPALCGTQRRASHRAVLSV